MLKPRTLSQSNLQINSLDGLRGLAVFMVFASHASNRGLHLLPSLNLEGIGKSGVFLFFILSSFLLTRAFFAADKLNTYFFSNYLLRRFTRIYPLYLFYLLLGLATTWIATKSTFLPAIPFNLSLAQFFDQLLLRGSLGVTWSIAVEFKYYFILPFFAIAYRLLLKQPIYWAALFTVSIICICEFVWPESQSLQNDIRAWPYITLFIQGGFAAFLFERHQKTIIHSRLLSILSLAALGLLAFSTPSLFAFFTGNPIARTQFHKLFFIHGLLWSLVLLGCISSAGILNKLFSSLPLRYLGFISFSLYLFHVVVLDLLRPFYNDIYGIAWIALTLGIMVSHITWTMIEKPFSSIKLKP